jgi:hypothetical protein
MSVGVAFNVFDGTELLRCAVEVVRPLAAYICVVAQRTSNYGEPADPSQDTVLSTLLKDGLVDDVVWFVPAGRPMPDEIAGGEVSSDSINPAFVFELRKRNLGLELCRARGCTLFMSMDADEFYDRGQLATVLLTMAQSPQVFAAACLMRYYWRSPRLELMPRDEAQYVPVAYNIAANATVRFRVAESFPVSVDPTRRMKSEGGKVWVCPRAVIEMHHMSFVRTRAGMLSKLRSVTNRANYAMTPEEFVERLGAWRPGMPPIHPHKLLSTTFQTLAECDDVFHIGDVFEGS